MTFLENSKLERIGNHCFCDCGLNCFCAPSSLKEIADYAFQDCSDLKLVSLHKNLETLGKPETP